ATCRALADVAAAGEPGEQVGAAGPRALVLRVEDALRSLLRAEFDLEVLASLLLGVGAREQPERLLARLLQALVLALASLDEAVGLLLDGLLPGGCDAVAERGDRLRRVVTRVNDALGQASHDPRAEAREHLRRGGDAQPVLEPARDTVPEALDLLLGRVPHRLDAAAEALDDSPPSLVPPRPGGLEPLADRLDPLLDGVRALGQHTHERDSQV